MLIQSAARVPQGVQEPIEILRIMTAWTSQLTLFLSLILSGFGNVFFAEIAIAEELSAFHCLSDTPAEEAAKTLRELQSKYATVKALSTRFVQQAYLSAMDTAETSEGQVKVLTPGRLKWIYEGKRPQIFLVNRETAWLYQQSENQVVVSDFRNNVSSQLAVTFLLGSGDLTRDFKSYRACKTSRGTLLQLIPISTEEKKGEKKAEKNDDGGLERFDLLVDTETNLPAGARTIDVAGNTNAVQFVGLSVSNSIPESEFQPKFPSGADVQDNRIQKAAVAKTGTMDAPS